MSDPQPQIVVPEMCRMHQHLLVTQVGIPESGPWRALIVMAQVTLFQAATADPVFYNRIDGDLKRIDEIGCLACFKPDAFGEIVEAAKKEPGAIKKLGESYVERGSKNPPVGRQGVFRRSERAYALFHRLWGEAVGKPGYIKQDWVALQLELEKL